MPSQQSEEVMRGQRPSSAQPASRSAPDILDFFAERGGRARQFQRQLEEAREEKQALATQLEEAQARVRSLEMKEDSWKAAADATRKHSEEMMGIMEQKLKQEVWKRQEALEQLHGAHGQQDELRRQLDEMAAQVQADAERHAEQVKQLHCRIRDRDSALSEAEAQVDAAAMQAYDRSVALTSTERELDGVRESMEEELSRLRQRLAEELQKTSKLEAECSELRRAPSTAGQAEDSTQVELEQLRKEVRRLQAEAAELPGLRLSAKQARMQREELLEAQRRAEILQQELQRIAAEQARLQGVEEENRALRARLAGVGGDGGSSDGGEARDDGAARVAVLESRLADAQDRIVGLQQLEAQLRQRAADADARALELQQQAAQLQQQASASQERAEGQDRRLAQQQSRARFLQAEVDDLRRAVDRYEAALLAAQPAAACAAEDGFTAEAAAAPQPADASVDQRQAQDELERLRGQASELQAQLESCESAVQHAQQGAAAAAAQLAEAQRRGAQLEREAELLAKENALLSERVGRGEYDPERTRVLHHRRSPWAVELQERLQLLEAENAALRESLDLLRCTSQEAAAPPLVEQGPRQADTSAAPGPGSAAAAQLAVELKVKEAERDRERRAKDELSKAVASKQRALDKMKKALQATVARLQQAVKELFGYKLLAELGRPTGGEAGAMKLTVVPRLASRDDEVFVFEMAPGGAVSLVPNAYSEFWHSDVQNYVHGWASVPAFLASVQLQLQDQKMSS